MAMPLEKGAIMYRKIIVAGLLGLVCGGAFAGDATPRVDKRQENQERRIEQGKDSGSLTAAEQANLEARQAKLAANEEAAKADGQVTKSERVKLRAETRRDSRAIARKKHNNRTAPAAN